ncbi:Gfo/Idh/MocA family oxidoreductase [uncultured Chloroflexus sp.]|uniref:Gfo/Idh/MocA family protein n=1 Tax=uncultured Chloroflexus sp. TaxID=214040 RepID=UPI002612667F|nr:Gfo/Idh/MocA family oxidoreductase [uncultured Chloroflexus sp.]
MIGIIGTGWGARVQVPAFRAAGLVVTALAGSNPAKTARIAHELEVPFATANWHEVLERSDVQVVSIVTPPYLHREMAEAALAAGKHVLCEKPTALNAAEAEAMLAAAQAHPAQLALIDHELRFLPAVQAARARLAAGDIGEARAAEVRFIASGRADPQRQWDWWSDRAAGGGVLGAIGSHQIDLLRFILADEVTQAQGLVQTFITQRPDAAGVLRSVTSDDYTTATLRFARGAVATLTAMVVARTNEPLSVTVYGSAGTLRFSGGRLFISSDDTFHDVTPPHTVELPATLNGEFPQGTVYLGHALRTALAGQREAIASAATFADGLAIQQVLDTIRGALV